jgi:DNA-directed RNA polymerase specialized sigma24 family protein
MSLTASFAPHLPYLRRYARALTGSQRSGDAYVRAALEALVAGEKELATDTTPRVALYHLFHVIWMSSTTDPQDRAVSPADAATPDGRLQSLMRSNREALLLTAVEGFSPRETARILGKNEDEIEREIVEAQQAIDKQLASRVLIIEDESIIALDLENLMTELGHEVVGIAATRDEAVKQARQQKPGLVLADIRLADGSSGIDAVSDILKGFDIPIIFITAYPERLLTGERPEPTYLITKPFLSTTVKATVGQALFFHPVKRRAA